MSKFKKLAKSKNSLDFFTFKARLVFIKLRQAFIQALIHHQFNSKHHIWIEADISGYAIVEILN